MTGIQRGISPSSNWIFPSTFHQQQTPFHHQHCRLFNNVIRLFTTNSVDFSTTSNAFPTATPYNNNRVAFHRTFRQRHLPFHQRHCRLFNNVKRLSNGDSRTTATTNPIKGKPQSSHAIFSPTWKRGRLLAKSINQKKPDWSWKRREKKKASQSEVIRTIADPTKLLRRRLGSA